MFLDIACFYPMGHHKERALLECASPSHVLDVLVDRSSVKIDVCKILEMHDQLWDMGRMIVETKKVYIDTWIWKKVMFPSANGQTNGVFHM